MRERILSLIVDAIARIISGGTLLPLDCHDESASLADSDRRSPPLVSNDFSQQRNLLIAVLVRVARVRD
jgi:hypothetical protein